MISKRLVLAGCAALMAVGLWPADAAAQVYVGVGVGYYRPYYRPYYPYYWGGFYSPFYSPFYNPFWYPYYAGYPAPYYYGPSYASARVEVKPTAARVYVDGYYVGVVDNFDGVFQRLDLPTGEHEIVVQLPGYRSYRQKNLFRPGEGYHFKAILEPLPPGTPDDPVPQPAPGNPEPREPENRQGPRDPYRPPQEQNPPYPGQRPYPRDPGRVEPMPGDRRAPQGGQFGTLNVRVQPGDAVIVIDGERWDSPEGGSRLILELAAGEHRIEVRKDGFRPYTSTVQIRPGESQTLNVSLPPGGLP